MYFKYLDKEGITDVISEIDDICVLCRYYDACPLIGAIATNVVYPSAEKLQIEDCVMYAPEEIYG